MKRIISTLLLAGLASFSYGQENNGEYNGRGVALVPDYTFKASALTGWHTLGSGLWQANNGTITAKASGVGYLISDKSFQDVGVRALFKADANTEVGFVFRMEKTDDGFKGLLVSVKGAETGAYRVTLDAQGKEKSREKLRTVGGIIRQAPAAPAPNPNATASAAGGPPRGTGGPRPGGGAPVNNLPVKRPTTAVVPGEWNQFDSALDLDVMRAYFNDGGEITGATEDGGNTYGPVALMINGTGEVQFKELGWQDVGLKRMPKEAGSSRFKVQQIQDMYYSWAAGSADFNRDGITDIVAGPYIYYGPDYTTSREIIFAASVAQSQHFTEFNCQYGYDFNGDGWPDVLSGPSTGTLFINPKGENRRWGRYKVITGIQSEVTAFKDVDGDGKPELIYAGGGQIKYAKPASAADATKPWVERVISERGTGGAHGLGVGDVNGDGLMDIVSMYGWWEHPKNDDGKSLWEHHPEAFARFGHRSSNFGGATMGVYDVNGDKLNDVVTSLNAHGFGLAWFEQKRDAAGKISFVRHMIIDDYSTKNAGDVTFSEAHGAAFADIDGDGIVDFITGKRYWSHLDTFLDPDPYGAPVVYVFKTVRDPKAPGGARFVPELVHNRSGVGSDVLATDLNKDGAIDIVTGTNRGVFIYWNTPKAGAKASAVKK